MQDTTYNVNAFACVLLRVYGFGRTFFYLSVCACNEGFNDFYCFHAPLSIGNRIGPSKIKV